MDRIDEVMDLMKGVIKAKEEEKKVNVFAIVLTVLVVVVAIAAAVYAVYRFTQPEFDDDFDEDFGDDDDLDEFFEDEEDDPIPVSRQVKPEGEEGAD